MPAAHADRPIWRVLGRALPVAVVMGALAALAIAATGCGEDKQDGRGASAQEATATKPAATSTPAPPTPTNEQVLAFLVAIAPTPAPGSTSGGGGGGGGGGAPAQAGAPYVPRRALSGPGPITGTAWTLSIPRIGVNASIYGRTVGEDGQMGNPAGPWDVIWYDFSSWGGDLGGAPGEGGSNVVLAGHVDYIRVGPAVFWSVKDLVPGDQVTLNTPSGPVTYAIQWSQWTGPYDDFTSYVAKQGQDVVTLVTCIGGFSAGSYSNRLVVRGVRI